MRAWIEGRIPSGEGSTDTGHGTIKAQTRYGVIGRIEIEGLVPYVQGS